MDSVETESSGHRKKTKAEINRFNSLAYFSWRFDGDEKGRYLILYGGDVRKKIVGIGSSFCTGRDNLDYIDKDGAPVTVLRCTERFEKAVLSSVLVNDAYSYISHRFAECDIRWMFPELWIAWKNAQAKKQQRREEHDYLEAKNQRKLKYLSHDARTIRNIMRRCDLRSAARHYGVI